MSTSSVDEVLVCEMGGLLATLRFDINLQKYELDEKSATILCHYEVNADVERNIFHALEKCVK